MNLSLRQLIFVVILLAVPLASFFLVFAPQNRDITKAKEEIELKKATLEKLREATSKTDDLLKANTDIRHSIESINARLPSDKDMDLVLRDVANIAAGAGLKIPTFRRADKPLPAGEAMEQPLDVTITGDFDGFYKFLQELEKLPRITRITDIKITRSDESDGEMKAEFKLSVYYKSEQQTASGGKS